MKKIPLTQGKFAIVDDEDYEWLNQHKWCVAHCTNKYYAVRFISVNKKRIQLYMHREIMGAMKGQEIDHRGGNSLDNRKSNLRFCTRSENLQNQHRTKNNSTKFKGVSWHKLRHKWQAYINFNKTRIQLGYFDNENDAAKAYDIEATKLFGEFANLNFPNG